MFQFNEDELTRISLQTKAELKQANLYEKLNLALEDQGDQAQLIHPTLKHGRSQEGDECIIVKGVVDTA